MVIKGLTFSFDGHKHPLHALHNAKQDFYHYYQTGQTTNPQYLDTFKNNFLVVQSYESYIVIVPLLAKEELEVIANPIDADNQRVNESAKIKYFGVAMLCRSDQGRYNKLVV